MLHPTPEQWKKWNIQHEHHKFFFLRWHELFDSSTFDSWQIRSANIRSLVNELAQSARTVVVAKNHHPNITAILDELELIIEHDRVIIERFPVIRSHITSLRRCYDEQIRPNDTSNVEPFLRIVRIIQTYLSRYTSLLFDEIERIIAERPAKYKQDLHMLVMLVGVELKNIGYSLYELRQATSMLCDDTHGPFENRIRALRTKFTQSDRTFNCQFLVRGPGDFSRLGDLGIGISYRPTHADGTQDTFWKQDPGDGVTALSCNVQAKDPYSARRLALQRIEEVLSYWRIYRPSKEHIVHDTGLIRSDDDSGRLIGTDAEFEGKTLRDARGPDRRATELMQELATIDHEHTRHVGAALQYFRMSLYARRQEARLINLWIALEALFQNIGQGSLIHRITGYVADIMALNYVQDTARAIPVDIRYVWRSSDTRKIRESLSKSTQEILHSEDFVRLMTTSDTSEIWRAFTALFSDNPLMIFRLWKLRNGMFKAPKEMGSRINRHRENVVWQVQRIYRLRNMIAHQGTTPDDASQLIGHLQTYFITTFHDIIHTLKHRRLASLGDILESRSMDYRYLHQRLSGASEKPVSVQFVTTGFAELDGPFEPFLWQSTTMETDSVPSAPEK